ncbi:uncharacterized protein LOC114932038 [Nylanderia fulva]|uniref:uncharacterized protein LOC114932038 n=1 Tax=Nylanderia fulva TaxID=613905 RepID=UPI0010FB0E55|nr:uncharacterized protein LOC114932038 [Nylanderia fulva]
MTETIQAALSPLLIVGSFCGLSFFEYPLGRPRLYLSSLYFLITWSLYVYLFYSLVYITKIYLVWTNLIVIICAIVSMFISLFRYKKLKTCLYKLSVVDDTLEMFGTSKEYRLLYKWTIKMTIGWILITLFMNLCDILWDYQDFNISNIWIPFIANHMFHVNTLNGLIWAAILRHIHLELCFISRELNKVFNTNDIANDILFYAFVELCCGIYTTYIDNNKDTFENVFSKIIIYIWAVVYTAKLFALNHICQIIYDKANETVAILYNLSNDNSDKDFREQILQFILQIKQKEVKFYGMGLFYFGYDFIRKFYAAVAAVLVIIIQMNITFDY